VPRQMRRRWPLGVPFREERLAQVQETTGGRKSAGQGVLVVLLCVCLCFWGSARVHGQQSDSIEVLSVRSPRMSTPASLGRPFPGRTGGSAFGSQPGPREPWNRRESLPVGRSPHVVYEDRYAPRYGDWRPVVERVLRRFLECGILGTRKRVPRFMRVACQDCKAEYMVPFSCKGRALCPSCGQRRAQEFSDFLQQEVLEDPRGVSQCLALPATHDLTRTWCSPFRRCCAPPSCGKGRLLRLLSRCAWNTVRLGLETALDRLVVPGAVVSVATAGDLTNHILIALHRLCGCLGPGFR